MYNHWNHHDQIDQFEPIEQLEMQQQEQTSTIHHDDIEESTITPILRRSSRITRPPATYTDTWNSKVGASVVKDHYTHKGNEQHEHMDEDWMEHKYDIEHQDPNVNINIHPSTPATSSISDEHELEEGEVPPDVVKSLTKHVRWADEDDRITSYEYVAYSCTVSTQHAVPSTYTQAITSEESNEWKTAMNDEMQSLKENNTWTLTTLPAGRKAIACKWVYDYKYDSRGKIIRHKARLVAKGFSQRYGVDYHETFSPVMRYKSMRLLLSLVANRDMELKQMDVCTAFLYAPIEEEVYMQQPEGYEEGSPQLVCKLNKTIYGTKQANREWNKMINNHLINMGFTRCISDTCMYVKRTKTGGTITIGLFVDDILIAYDKRDESEWLGLQQQLMSRFKMKDLGDCKLILGMRVTRDRKNKTLTIDNEVHIKRTLAAHGMSDCKALSTPSTTTQLIPCLPHEQNIVDIQQYQSIVGSLNYLSQSCRPDISFAVNRLCRYASNPSPSHLQAAKRVLRYLKGTSEVGLTYSGGVSGNIYKDNMMITVEMWTDADWGGDTSDRKSTTGYVVKVGGNTISWATKKQQTVALSTAEAEYMALSSGIQEQISIEQLMGELIGKRMINLPSIVYTDNQSAIVISKDDNNHQRTKHIDIRHHFIRDHVREGRALIKWTPTQLQIADILTKALGR